MVPRCSDGNVVNEHLTKVMVVDLEGDGILGTEWNSNFANDCDIDEMKSLCARDLVQLEILRK